jgi:hypothetical protein
VNDHWIIKKIRGEIKKFLESSENESTTYQNFWDTAKLLLIRKCIALSLHTPVDRYKTETPQVT